MLSARAVTLRRYGNWGLAALMSLLAWTDPGAGVDLVSQALAADLTFEAPRPVSARPADGDRELVLSFRQAIDPKPFDATAKAHPDLIEFVNVGYDSVLIRFTRPVTFAMRYMPAAFVIDVRALDASASTDDRDADSRVQIQLARIDLMSGAYGAALERLRQANSRNPNDADTKAVLADAADAAGLWRQGRAARLEARALRPFDAGLSESQNRAGREFGPRLRIENDALWVEKTYRQYISLVSVNALATDRTEIGAIMENRSVATDRGITLQGQTVYFNGVRRRGDFYLTHEHDDDSTTRGSLLAGPASVGGSLAHTRRDLGGLSRLRIEYQQPFFDIVAGIINHATRDAADLRHEIKLAPEITAYAGTGITRYGIDTHSDVSRTALASGGLRYGKNLSELYGTFGYTMEGEYLLNEHQLPDLNGRDFRALAIVNRELHAFDVTLAQPLFGAFRYDAQLGYGFNRFGTEGAFAALALAYGPGDLPFEIGLRGGWSRFGRFGEAGDLTRAGAYLNWRF